MYNILYVPYHWAELPVTIIKALLPLILITLITAQLNQPVILLVRLPINCKLPSLLIISRLSRLPTLLYSCIISPSTQLNYPQLMNNITFYSAKLPATHEQCHLLLSHCTSNSYYVTYNLTFCSAELYPQIMVNLTFYRTILPTTHV